MKFEWHTPASKAFIICYEHSIHFDIEWVPRGCNTRVVFICKLIDFDDGQVTEDVFKDSGSCCGPYTAGCIIREPRAPMLFHYFSGRVLALLTNVYYTFIQDLRVLSE